MTPHPDATEEEREMTQPNAATPRTLGLQPDAAGAIYGTIAAMAVIAGAARYQSDAQVFALTLVTLLVLWLAHVYAETLAHHLKRRGKPQWSSVAAAMAKERTMLEGPAPMLLLLGLGGIGVLEEDLALTLALWIGLAQLVAWGVTYARRLEWGWPSAIAAGLVNGAFGFIIVLLEVIVH
jgi:hypothetical protein